VTWITKAEKQENADTEAKQTAVYTPILDVNNYLLYP